jgi:hypothetical protein
MLPKLFLFAVTGASRGYAFVEYETDREMRRAYEVSAIYGLSSVLLLFYCIESVLYLKENYTSLPLPSRMHTIQLLMAVK